MDGEANACLIGFLAEALGVPRRAVAIEAGLSARRKRVVVQAPQRGPEALWTD